MPTMRKTSAPSQAQRRPANVLVLLRISYCSPAQRSAAREQRIEKLNKLVDDGPARLNPRPGRVLDRRLWLTVSLRRAKIAKRWEVLRDLRAGKLPR